jgi:hypothetical protein
MIWVARLLILACMTAAVVWLLLLLYGGACDANLCGVLQQIPVESA